MTEHTPTPWTKEAYTKEEPCSRCDGNAHYSAIGPLGGGSVEGDFVILATPDDAEFIVRACNSHDVMVAALSLAQSYHDDEYDAIRCPVCEACGEPDEKLEHEQDCPIRVALAKAKKAHD